MTQLEFHNNVNFLINKEQGGYFSPEDIDTRQQMAQMAIFNDYYTDFMKTQVVVSALLPFKNTYRFSTTDTTNGVLITPLGYLYCTNLRCSQYDNKAKRTSNTTVKIFKDDEMGDALDSQVCEPTVTSPIANESNGIFQLYPKVPQMGEMTYLRLPVKPKFAYTQAGRVITYIPANPSNPNASIDPEWRETEINKIILKTVELLGITLSDPSLVQYVGTSVANGFKSPTAI